jgi:hypothetical protein
MQLAGGAFSVVGQRARDDCQQGAGGDQQQGGGGLLPGDRLGWCLHGCCAVLPDQVAAVTRERDHDHETGGQQRRPRSPGRR